MSDWNQISQQGRDVMDELGDFGPTVHAANREVKGYMNPGDDGDGRTYWNSADLRRIAAGCIEVADWLDARALAAPPAGG